MHLKLVIPLTASLFLQRYFQILDNQFLTRINDKALTLFNINSSLGIIGNFIGYATITSVFILWKQEEHRNQQKSILNNNLKLATLACAVVVFILTPFLKEISLHYKTWGTFGAFSVVYLFIGLINIVCLTGYLVLDGFLIATNKIGGSVKISFWIVATKFLTYFCLYKFINIDGIISPDEIQAVLLLGLLLTVLLYLLAAAIIYKKVASDLPRNSNSMSLKEITSIWKHEFLFSFVRFATPLVYAYQIGFVKTESSFLVTYNLLLHLSYILCLPVMAGLQLAIRDASDPQSKHQWFYQFLYTSYIPAALFMLGVSVFPEIIIKYFYGYTIPATHYSFVVIYCVACVFGQIGHIFSVPLRANKRSKLVSRNILIAELGVLIGGAQLLIFLDLLSPENLGIITFLFCLVYSGLNIISARKYFSSKKVFFPFFREKVV